MKGKRRHGGLTSGPPGSSVRRDVLLRKLRKAARLDQRLRKGRATCPIGASQLWHRYGKPEGPKQTGIDPGQDEGARRTAERIGRLIDDAAAIAVRIRRGRKRG